MSSKAAATEADTEENTEGKVAPKWRAAVDFKFIRDNAELVQSNAVARKAVVDVAQVVTLYDQWLAVKSTADDMRASRNASAAKMKGKLEQAQRDVRASPLVTLSQCTAGATASFSSYTHRCASSTHGLLSKAHLRIDANPHSQIRVLPQRGGTRR